MNKEFLLTQSKVFCMLPWIHFMATPTGDVYPCCVGVSSDKFDKMTDTSTFNGIINNEKFKELRSNMMTEIKSPACKDCYELEKFGSSFRTYANESFGHFLEEVFNNTSSDGYLNNFKMRYYDIRFRNICNFKCRTCGPEYSTAWALEENKIANTSHKVYDISKETTILDEFLSHINDVEFVYFAGGEPLITEEHYLILEELIKQKRTNVKIRYNTNCSVLQYKNKDVLSLWKHFDKINLSASIDHIEERAEYIRSGTDWAVIDSNLRLLRNIENIELTVNTVLSVFNYETLNLLIEYLTNIKIFAPNNWYNSIINTSHPSYFSSTILPKNHKDIGTTALNATIDKLINMGNMSQIDLLKNAINFTNSVDNWDKEKENFLKEITKKDTHRNESFVKTFPELRDLYE